MERWKGWLCFNFKCSFLLPTKDMFVKVNPCLGDKAEEKGHGLVSLDKDMEACAGYADIQVMWEMIHSSHPANYHNNKGSKRPSQWGFCFRKQVSNSFDTQLLWVTPLDSIEGPFFTLYEEK